MKFDKLSVFVVLAYTANGAAPALAIDWLTVPSYYTHDRVTGERTSQFAAIGPFYYYGRPDYMKSGYRHYRSTIQAGGSADNLHIVEEWGRPVVPYEQWRFPYRPYGSPYQEWGPPYGGLGGSGLGPYGGIGPYPFPYGGMGGGFGGSFGHGHKGPPANFAQPWLDGYYPEYNQQDRSRYYEPYVAPDK
jgi:hypothetical protein